MNNAQLTDDLNQLLANITRSLMAHLHQARPYVTAATYRIGADLDRMNRANQGHAICLADLLARLELAELPQPFPPDVANYHFVSVPSLLPVLIQEKAQHVQLCQQALEHAIATPGYNIPSPALPSGSGGGWEGASPADPADVLAELRSLLAQNQDELTRLQKHAQTLGLDQPSVNR